MNDDPMFSLPVFDRPEMESLVTREDSAKLKTQLRFKFMNAVRSKNAKEFLNDELPEPGWTMCVLGIGNFDFWNVIAYALYLAGGEIDFLMLTTWAANRFVAEEIVQLHNSRTVKEILLFVDQSFRKRAPDTWAFLLDHTHGVDTFNMYSLPNHAKIAAFKTADGRHYVIAGSANLNGNPRLEENFISHSKELFDFFVNEYKSFIPKARKGVKE